MSPKEKALELVGKFNIPHPFQGLAKQCAQVAADEILLDRKSLMEHHWVDLEYWQEVKQEIENL